MNEQFDFSHSTRVTPIALMMDDMVFVCVGGGGESKSKGSL